MTNDQKKVIYALAAFVGFKVVLWVGIHYAAKTARALRQGESVNA